MSAICPRAPLASADLDLKLTQLDSNVTLVRFHSPEYPATAFNPNNGRNMEDVLQGARFSPFPGGEGANVPTIYAATSEHAAALESVFHDVPHVRNPTFPTSKLSMFVESRFTLTRPIAVLDLVNAQLRQVTLEGRDSLDEGELIHSRASQYPATRSWARHFHQSLQNVEALCWRPRLGGEGLAYVFFGDRVTSASFKMVGPSTPIHIDPIRTRINHIAAAAHIRLITT